MQHAVKVEDKSEKHGKKEGFLKVVNKGLR
jgi:hypothetical protein